MKRSNKIQIEIELTVKKMISLYCKDKIRYEKE